MIYFWLGALIFFIFVESSTVSLVSIWFALGALFALLGASLNCSIYLQWVVFFVVSGVAIIASRPIADKYLKTKTVHTNLDRIINKHGLVTSTITADIRGEVKVMSMLWSATSIDNSTIEQDSYCEVIAVEGSHLIVRKIEK